MPASARKTFLVIHRNFPGQFERLVRALIVDGHRVVGIGQNSQPISLEPMPKALEYHQYRVEGVSAENVHPFVWNFEGHMRRATGVARLCMWLKQAHKFAPDQVLAHTGWGEGLLLKEVFPATEMIGFFEYYYHPSGTDVGFDPEFATSTDDQARARMKNVTPLMSLDVFDRGYSPTEWQRKTYPSFAQAKLEVLHDGIDTKKASPNPNVALRLGADLRLKRSDNAKPIVSFVARSLEPYRGIHVFTRAIAEIQRKLAGAQIVIVGEETTSYGKPRPDNVSHFKFYMDQVADQVDLSRIHVLGSVSHDVLMGILQASSAHVYLTYPFVLSWSMLEAMACGATVIASDVDPVKEVITHGKTGYLVDFFDHQALADQVIRVCKKPNPNLTQAARELIVSRYDWQTASLPKFRRMLGVTAKWVGKTSSVAVDKKPTARPKAPAAKPRAKTGAKTAAKAAKKR